MLTDCNNKLRNSLFLVGEIGGNDYNHPFYRGRSLAEIRTFVPLVIRAISSAITVSRMIHISFSTICFHICFSSLTNSRSARSQGTDRTWSQDPGSSRKLSNWMHRKISLPIRNISKRRLRSSNWMHQLVERVCRVP